MVRTNTRGLGILIAIAGLAGHAAGQCQQEWLPGPTGTFGTYGTDMPVDATTIWHPSGSPVPMLVVAGRFNSIAGGLFSHIAAWDGTQWIRLGSGMNGAVQSVFDFNGTLVATGLFTSAGGVSVSNIARWTGSAWQAMGSLNDYGSALAMHSGFLFVGGAFTSASGVAANHLARWNGSAWQGVNAGLGGPVTALGNFPVSGSSVESLIIGGNFTTANGMAANHIVGYNLGLATPWYTLGTGTNGQVNAIKGGLGSLYIGGTFTSAGGVSTGGFARWNGFSWQDNGGFFNGTVYALENYFDQVTGTQQLVIGGLYPGISNSPNLAYYNGSSYSTLGTGGTGMNGSVFTLANYNSSLVIGGAFSSAGGTFVQNLARWSGAPSAANPSQSGWTPLTPAPSAPVRALLPVGTSGLYVGGDFTFTIDSSTAVAHLFETDGSTASPVTNCFGCGLANGTTGSVSALGTFTVGQPIPRTQLIIGGHFTQAGGFNASNIAQFSSLNGYAAMGTGTDGRVDAVLQFGNHLIAAGEFTTAGGVSAPGIAQWNGSWTGLGSGLARSSGPGLGYALAIYNNQLIAGGDFASAGGVAAHAVARWDGTSWQPLAGATLTGTVRALTVFNNLLIAAGDFSSTSPTLDRVAAWNGSAWTPMNAGLPSSAILSATSLTVHNGDLYLGAASPFTEGPGSPRTVYRWTGSSWAAIPGSPFRPVYALASAAGALWAGGDFGVASGHATPYLAKQQCACYANCDGSVTPPVLNVNDFVCFQNQFAAGNTYANCDNSTTPPVLNVNDFICFQARFAAGCP